MRKPAKNPVRRSRRAPSKRPAAPPPTEDDDDFVVLFPVGVYDPPFEGLPFIGYVGMPTGDYLIRPFGTRHEALTYVENVVTTLALRQGR